MIQGFMGNLYNLMFAMLAMDRIRKNWQIDWA